MSNLGLRIVETRKGGPCSACGDGDTAMEYHTHEPPPLRYTLKEIEALAREFVDRSPNFAGDQRLSERLAVSTFLQWLARREREGRG